MFHRQAVGLISSTGRGILVNFRSFYANLSPQKITELLSKNQATIDKSSIPSYIKSIECNQLASNSPIEDRLRISSVNVPGFDEPTLILGVFDGHGGGTTADLISRRLFNYIALSLLPESGRLKISTQEQLDNMLVDLYNSPKPSGVGSLQKRELKSLVYYNQELDDDSDIAARLKASFRRCDDDLSKEIQENLTNPKNDTSILHYYLSAAVSGCCALVMIIHDGFAYLASTGDCRAVLGVYGMDNNQAGANETNSVTSQMFSATELNDEHNCDNIDEIRRLSSAHPKSEQNTMIKHNRLLGHLMPFRAFGDFNYKWPADLIKSCGITRAFGSGVIPSHYNTPPYLIADPDVNEMKIDVFSSNITGCNLTLDKDNLEKCLVIASDGLWELFESSRDVIETLVDHSLNSNNENSALDYDKNCATHILRSALRSGSYQDIGKDAEELKRLYHVRLESILTLPQAVVRNFRDDISIIVMRL